MELLVQTYLKSGKTLDDLFTEHGVCHYISNGKLGLNYSQLDASNSDPLACQCRGLILDEKTFEIIACPFFRFFNLEQTEVAAPIDWNTARFFDKIDGTCIICGFKDKWFVGTRGRPEADGNIQDSDLTFATLADLAVDKMLKENSACSGSKTFHDMMEYIVLKYGEQIRNYTFVFELTSPFNRVVCKYDKISLTLLMVRNNKTLEELDPKQFDFGPYGIKTPEEFYFSNVNHMVQVIREWNPEEKEGVVVVDKNYNRVKVKNPAYVAFNHLKDSLSTSIRGCIEVILLEKDDDVIPMMPQVIADRIRMLKPIVARVLKQTEQDWQELKHIENMKEFALEAQKRLWDSALFALKRNKTPDLKTYSLGNVLDKAKIPSGASEKMLALCLKLDPAAVNSIKSLRVELE